MCLLSRPPKLPRRQGSRLHPQSSRARTGFEFGSGVALSVYMTLLVLVRLVMPSKARSNLRKARVFIANEDFANDAPITVHLVPLNRYLLAES